MNPRTLNRDPKIERVLIAGSGGQGIVLIGRLFAGMALPYIPNITFFPAYGAEVRGGLSNCQLVFSDRDIASPVNSVFDAMILMNDAGAMRYRDALSPAGTLVYESSLCASLDGSQGTGVDATRMADAMGDRRAANFIMLGALLAIRPLFPPDRLEAEVATLFAGKPETVLKRNIAAFQAGRAAVASASRPLRG